MIVKLLLRSRHIGLFGRYFVFSFLANFVQNGPDDRQDDKNGDPDDIFFILPEKLLPAVFFLNGLDFLDDLLFFLGHAVTADKRRWLLIM